MAILVIMPIACPEKIPTLRAHIDAKFRGTKKKKPSISIISAYERIVHETIDRQTMVYIANTVPKLIKKNDIVYIVVVNNPTLMAIMSVRVFRRINTLFSKRQRNWFLLEYDPRAKLFIEYYLP